MSNFDYNKDRIGPQQEQLATKATNGIMQILGAATKALSSPGEKACMLAGSTIPAVLGLSTLFGDADNIDDVKLDVDSAIWGALYVMNSLENHPAGLIAGFSMAILDKTQEDFKQRTGREFKLGTGPTALLKQYHEEMGKVSVPEHLKKFVG